jgi:hypothetical protein
LTIPRPADPNDPGRTADPRAEGRPADQAGHGHAGQQAALLIRCGAALALRQPQAAQRRCADQMGEGAGLRDHVPAGEMHVTVLFSRTPSTG